MCPVHVLQLPEETQPLWCAEDSVLIPALPPKGPFFPRLLDFSWFTSSLVHFWAGWKNPFALKPQGFASQSWGLSAIPQG